jgi:ABC-type lipoprotein export system ATPase subunit
MLAFELQMEPGWKWGGVGYLAAFTAAVLGLTAWVIGRARDEGPRGTSRRTGAGHGSPGAAAAGGDKAVVDVGAPASLPVQPVTLALRGLGYAVTVPIAAVQPSGGAAPPRGSAADWRGTLQQLASLAGRRPTTSRNLLEGVTAVAEPGSLTAVLGASGAGKSTLLDSVSFSKTRGVIRGEVLVNGAAMGPAGMSRVCGYVQQSDLHVPTDTVREALEVAARLRLPPSVMPAQRAALVASLLRDLELEELADRRVGDADSDASTKGGTGSNEGPGSTQTLSPGQRKRLTIGVELAANAALLLCDE